MELSPKFIWAPCAQLYSLAETPQLSPPPAFGLISDVAIGQPRYTTSLYGVSLSCNNKRLHQRVLNDL